MFSFIPSGQHIFCANEDLSVVLCLYNMVFELKFSRFEEQPWGFRLSGGNDFPLPLTVVKVTPGGLAESLGMIVGDIVVRVNDTPTSNLAHDAAHELIVGCGNNFIMAVMRRDEGDSVCSDVSNEQCLSPQFRQTHTPDSVAYSDMSEVTIETNRTESRVSDGKQSSAPTDISEDQIAELISGEAEVLKEHNVIGVNFKKIIPKSGLFKSSEVFKHLNDEAIKTKAEKESEVKRWTTFMQKPDRPIPKSPAQLENERRAKLRYQIKICKQPKPRCDPNRPKTPPRTATPEVVPTPEPDHKVETEGEKHCENNGCGTDDESEAIVEPNPADNMENEDLVPETAEMSEEVKTDENVAEEIIIDPPEPISTKSNEERMLENQLADVQKQLLALSTLPLAIQATLDAVTKQLAQLVPALQHTQKPPLEDASIESADIIVSEPNKEETAGTEGIMDESESQKDSEAPPISAADKNEDGHQRSSETDGDDSVDSINENDCDRHEEGNDCDDSVKEEEEEDEGLKAQEDIDKQRMEKCYRRQEEAWITKREKEKRMLEAEEALKNPRLPRRLSKSHGGPLTPQGRPVVLPGGRKWRNERDAFNEDFIAEVISSQAELISGNALGPTFESPLLKYDEGDNNCATIAHKIESDLVNFLKYKKPEKDLSCLDRSETFKIIHQKEREPRHGIQVRPSKVLCEDEVRIRSTPVSWV